MLFPERFLKCHAENRYIISHFINNPLPDWLMFDYPNAVSLLCTCIRNGLLDSKKSKKLVACVNCDLKGLRDEEIMLLKSQGFFDDIKEYMMKGLHNGNAFSYTKINGQSVELAYFVKYCLMTDHEGERFTTLLNNTLVGLENSSVFNELEEVLTQHSEILEYIKEVIANKGQELCDFFTRL